MTNLEKEIEEKFGGKLRTRVNGVLIQNDEILMIKHRMGKGHHFWNVPGGGMDYGTSALENLKREFKEETGLDIEVREFLFTYEFLDIPLHAIELFFRVEAVGGTLVLGTDPELTSDKQLITAIRFLNIEKLSLIKKEEKHRLFWGIKSLKEIGMWKGYFNFENNCIK